MSDLYKRIYDLCSEKGISIGKMCSELNISRGNLSDLKMNRIKTLNPDKITRISKYFGVSTDYLLGNEQEKKAPVLTEKDKRDIAKEVEDIMNHLEDEETLMFDGVPMSEEARESIKAAMKLGLEAAKLKNKERYTPKKYK